MDWTWFVVGLLAGSVAMWAMLARRQQAHASELDLARRNLAWQAAADRALEASESRLRHLIDVVPAAFFLTNLEGECLLVNQHWRVLTGLPDEVSIGHGWIGAIHPDDRPRVTGGMGDPARAGQSFEDTYRVQRPDGTVSWVRTNAVPLNDPDGTLTGYAGFSLDITALIEARDAIRTLRGLIPICASCKKIRDDGGYWNQLEQYISAHTDAEFSHSLCPSCLESALSEEES
jgi:PAS domain S-box-containing protein